MSYARLAVFGATLAIGCSGEEATLALQPRPDAPAEVTRATARLSVASLLSSSGTTIGSRSEKNSVSIELDVLFHESPTDGAIFETRSACLVGERIWATGFVGAGNTTGAAAGEHRTVSASQFMPNAFAAGPPSACEVEWRYRYGRAADSHTFDPLPLGRLCYSDIDGLSEGACSSNALKRAIPSVPLLAGPAAASWQAGSLVFHAAISAGEGFWATGDLVASTACATGSEPPWSGRTTLVKGLSDYRPGETFLIVGELLRVPEIEQRYERCTLEIRYRPAPSERPDEQNPIASYCVERGKELEPREGACEGLAPGGATVRLDEHLRATIERGSHREGPFELGPAGSMQPLLDSLVRSNDESVVFVAPPELPQADVLALIEGVRRALPRRPVSVSLP